MPLTTLVLTSSWQASSKEVANCLLFREQTVIRAQGLDYNNQMNVFDSLKWRPCGVIVHCNVFFRTAPSVVYWQQVWRTPWLSVDKKNWEPLKTSTLTLPSTRASWASCWSCTRRDACPPPYHSWACRIEHTCLNGPSPIRFSYDDSRACDNAYKQPTCAGAG
jgi:hypothetical protein